MEYKCYEYPSFKIHTIKTNRFKTVNMEIIFRSQVKKEECMPKTFLADLLTDCSNTYKSRKEVVKKLEELYQASFYGITNKIGNVFMTSFVLSFLNPSFVKSDTYLEEVIKLPFDMLLNPFLEADEFNIKNFKIIKNRLHDEILSINEDINRVSLKNALNLLDKKSPSSYGILGTIEELYAITPKTLKDCYDNLLNNSCDIFIIGNLDMDEVANLIFKYFKNPVIKTEELSFYVENKTLKNIQKLIENGNFTETCLVNIYNISNLTPKEKTTIFYFYNYLLGGGGLNTKLYQLLREKNSLCYGVRSIYLKYENLLVIETSINKKDVKKCNKLIKQAFKEMAEGKFSDEEIEYAKQNFIFSLNLAEDDPAGILNNYVFHIFDDLPLLNERIKLIKDIKKTDIINVASKIKPCIEYVLEGATYEEN